MYFVELWNDLSDVLDYLARNRWNTCTLWMVDGNISENK